MNEKTIDTLCEKFHTTTSNLISAYSHYMIHKDIGIIILSIILMIISTIVILLVIKKAKKTYETSFSYFYDWEFRYATTVIICGVMIFIILIVLFFTIYDLTLWNTSPEMRFLDVMANSNQEV